MERIVVLSTIILMSLVSVSSQVNYDESLVPEFDLPKILTSTKGNEIVTTSDWEKTRRPEILEIFTDQMFGRIPAKAITTSFEVIKSIENALGGKAHLKEIKMIFQNGNKSLAANLCLILPVNSKTKIPLFLGMNFYGNHTTHPDENISISSSWVGNNTSFHIFDHKANHLSRGVRANRWPIEYILSRGYGLALIYYGEIDPDFDDGFQNGIQPLAYSSGQKNPKASEWGSIAAWSWSLSRALDYLEQEPLVDAKRVAVIGHSRLGKTALWAGATDERFSMVISNNSGCGGAALSKRRFGETIKVINTNFPHWFCDNFKQYNDQEGSLPFDQHMLLSLIAPRPLYVASATQDEWADPKGEYLSIAYAGKVYQLYGHKSLNSASTPIADTPIWKGNTGYHLRTGKHDLTKYDWKQYLDFADKHLK